MRGYIELEYNIRNNLQFPIKNHFQRRNMYELNLANILCDVKDRKFRLVSKTTPKNVNCSTLSNYFSSIIITYIA